MVQGDDWEERWEGGKGEVWEEGKGDVWDWGKGDVWDLGKGDVWEGFGDKWEGLGEIVWEEELEGVAGLQDRYSAT